MKKTSATFRKVTNENGEAFYCAYGDQAEAGRPVADPETCVEVSTVERYSGNLNVSD